MTSSFRPFRVLFVCTGNICRSPMGQAMLTSRLRASLGAAAGDLVEVTSAGTYGLGGHPIEPDALVVLDERGVAPAGSAARGMAKAPLEDPGLVLTAPGEHRGAGVPMQPRGSRQTFTLGEFARLVAAVDLAGLSGDDAVSRARALVDAA